MLPTVVSQRDTRRLVQHGAYALASKDVCFCQPLQVACVGYEVHRYCLEALIRDARVLLYNLRRDICVTSLFILRVRLRYVARAMSQGRAQEGDGCDDVLGVYHETVCPTSGHLCVIFLTKAFIPKFRLRGRRAGQASLSKRRSMAYRFLRVYRLQSVFRALLSAFCSHVHDLR